MAPLVLTQGFTNTRCTPAATIRLDVIGRRDVTARRHLDRCRPAQPPLQLRDPGHRRRDLVDGVVHGDPPVPSSRHPTQRRRAVTTDVDGRPRLLRRLRLEHHRVEVEVGAVVLDDRLAPQPAADVDALVDTAASGGEVEAHGVPFRLHPAGTDSELDPTAGEHVQGGHGTGRHERVAQPDVVHVGSEVDALGAGRQVRQVAERVEHRHVRRDGRVLARPRRGCRTCRPGAPGARGSTPTRSRARRRPGSRRPTPWTTSPPTRSRTSPITLLVRIRTGARPGHRGPARPGPLTAEMQKSAT